MKQHEFEKTLNIYLIGFGISLLLSLLSFLSVATGWFGDMSMYGAAFLVTLAVIQLLVQLICFLHLGLGPKKLVKTHIFLFTFSTLLIVVIGSLWIMRNLDYRMGMSPEQMFQYMQQQNNKGF